MATHGSYFVIPLYAPYLSVIQILIHYSHQRAFVHVGRKVTSDQQCTDTHVSFSLIPIVISTKLTAGRSLAKIPSPATLTESQYPNNYT